MNGEAIPSNGRAELALWKAAAGALMAFVMGNAVAFALFGIHTASKSDVDNVQSQLANRMQALESRDAALEATVNQMLGTLRARRIEP